MDEPGPLHNPSDPEEPTRPDGDEPPPLSPEEQMARFEEALKEEDWGHQPC